MKRTVILMMLGAIVLFALAGCMSRDTVSSESTQPPAPEVTEPSAPPETEPLPTEPPFEAACTADSDPANWNTLWEIMADGTVTDSYVREEAIFFDDADSFVLPGISTFRGNHYRTEANYGTAQITDGTISMLWKMHVGYVNTPSWGGCCWTGQPLVVQWDEDTRAIMNLHDEKKEKEDLAEVIYAKADGYIHFFDMEDGSETRDPLYVGMAFKGGGAIDPRGYPLLYVGSGLPHGGNNQKMYIISLIDGSILYERSCCEDSCFRQWYGLDGAPLVDTETDTLIWAGENGLIYTIKLNTQYDKTAGTVSVDPDEPVMTRYKDDYSTAGRNSGYESSITAVENYLYVGDNSGMLQCVDMNTMELVWAQDMVDDINATPLFDWGADGNGYIYTAPSMDYSRYGSALPICKIDARTGQILWTHAMECGTQKDVPGGVLASPVLGRTGTDMENLIIFSVGCSPTVREGQVVALDKESGEVVWQFETEHYMWSSPIALYTEDNKGYLFQADADGICYLLDGATGEEVGRTDVDVTVEASPVAFGNRVVLGSRTSIYLFEIS